MEIYITLISSFFLQIVQRNDKLLANNSFEQFFKILGFLCQAYLHAVPIKVILY